VNHRISSVVVASSFIEILWICNNNLLLKHQYSIDKLAVQLSLLVEVSLKSLYFILHLY
jgi:hypothetical protein